MGKSQRTLSNPSGVHTPVGRYSHLARVKANEFLFLAGQVSVNESGEIVGKDDIGIQTQQAYKNVGRILESEGATFSNVVQVNTYLVGRDAIQPYLTARAVIFDEIYPTNEQPPNTLLIVNGLFEEEMLIEVAVVAALP